MLPCFISAPVLNLLSVYEISLSDCLDIQVTAVCGLLQKKYVCPATFAT